MKYRGFIISCDPKPIPSRSFDWDYVHEDYDGPGDHRCGSCASKESAMVEIDEFIRGEQEEELARW